MTDAERIIELERELADTRDAALSIIVGMADAIAPSSEDKLELADGFANAADGAGRSLGDLSREVAVTLRRIAEDAGDRG